MRQGSSRCYQIGAVLQRSKGDAGLEIDRGLLDLGCSRRAGFADEMGWVPRANFWGAQGKNGGFFFSLGFRYQARGRAKC